MLGPWLRDLESLESLEAISQDDTSRRLFLRMAAMSRQGTIGHFMHALADDPDVDEQTKGALGEIARDHSFLLAVEEYLNRTCRFH
jgi:hypothetical protein